ncbi:MAG: L-fucose/L-arabinose isomerase family protein [Anaerolineales bacterium]|jgi:L-fucose isomerase-like protein
MSADTLLCLPIARTTFDLALAQELAEAARRRLSEAGFSIVGPTELLTDHEAIEESSRNWAHAGHPYAVVLQTTFADSTLVNLIADKLTVPLLLWGFPEAPTGERLRLNSFCGINLAAHSLTLRGHPYSHLYALPDDPEVPSQIAAFSSAARAYSHLRQARLGVLGEHPPGMDSCHLDTTALEGQLGVEVETLDLKKTLQASSDWNSPEALATYQQLSTSLENLADLDQQKVLGTLTVFQSLERLAKDHNLDGIAVRCWPEFFTDLGCAACGALSMLADRRIACSCEADANGTITQMLLGWLSGQASFGVDMVYFDRQADRCVLWHCGLAPLSTADPTFKPRGALHSNRQVPLVMEFPLKPGRVTLARLSRASGSLQMVIAGGEMLSAPLSFSGTSGVLRFDRPAEEVLDTILQKGLEHHISLTYGDHQQSLEQIARWLNIPIFQLT